MSTSSAPLPQTWDLSSYFPSLTDPAYVDFKLRLSADLKAALASAGSAAAPTAGGWIRLFTTWEDLGSRAAHLGSFLGCQGAADTSSERVQSEEAALALVDAELAKLKTRLVLQLRAFDDNAFVRLLADPGAANASHTISRLRAEATYQMPVELEALASDLGVDGFKAWGRLYDTLSGRMTFAMTFPDGRQEQVPMAQRRALLSHPDRAVRQAAFVGGNKVWAAAGDTCAAALNALAGTRHTLYSRRGRGDFLEAPLHDAALSRSTLDALFAAIASRYQVPRRLLSLGARLQKTPALAWYDLDAPRPLNQPVPTYTWDEGVAAVQSAFDASYPKLGHYFRDIVAKRWIEAEKRAHKRSGAFQTSSPVTREERIFMTFAGTVNDVVTLAHEAGHAWHTHVLAGLRPCAREYPMTLAETASTFAEKILVHGLLSEPSLTRDRRAFLLDMETNHTPAYLLNIPVRFLFESRFYEERKRGVVPTSRLCELMVQAQREVYGDVLASGEEDPWFWASKLHFFITDVSFYNFPYTFGFLLSQALFARFRKEGPSFLTRYEAFLQASGRASCEDAVQSTLGWDIRTPDFWTEAIDACGEAINDFEGALNPAR
ncbi:MAG: M3 family oligoendopeptidase [Opitutaceae bacterium]|nr:M3 family oligoendopeptidase [Opitutaceae bacterium]